MKYTLGQAANETGVSKPTISRAIKKGDLSADGGQGQPYRIDPSELGRWLQGYRERNPIVTTSATLVETPVTSSDNSELQAEVEALRQQIEAANSERDREREQLQDHIADLRGRVERAERKEDQLQALLTDERQKVTPTPSRRFFGLLRG